MKNQKYTIKKIIGHKKTWKNKNRIQNKTSTIKTENETRQHVQCHAVLTSRGSERTLTAAITELMSPPLGICDERREGRKVKGGRQTRE